MNDSDPEIITLDLEQCAVDALAGAIADYTTLCGDQEDFVKAFLSWTWHTKDSKKLMELYNNRPEKLRRKKK